MRLTSLLLIPALLLCPLLVAGCASSTPPSTTSTNTSVYFDSQVLYSPPSPVVGTLITITFTIANSTTGTGNLQAIPYLITLDGTGVTSGLTSTMTPNGQTTTSTTIQISTTGAHTVAVVLDPNAFTGFVNPAANSETVTITVLPSSTI